MKKKKAGDHEGWKNELIVAGGCEMVKSLAVLFNKLLENLVVPKQWEHMTIISIYKNKGKITEMKNRRGIFLTSVIGKVFEKVALRKIEGDIKLGTFQNGGRKERSTKDNILGVMAVIDRNKYNNKETCLILADAEKCFAKPWLEDCLVDIVKPGLREREALHMYTLNEKARIKIDALFGETEQITVENTVKQGTIFGPILCCGSMAEMNNIGETKASRRLTKDDDIEALVYVDDIGAAGSRTTINELGKNLRQMEREKGVTFNVEKTNIMLIGKAKNETEMDIQLKNGLVREVEEYKFLGNWLNKKGNMAEGIIVEIKRITKEEDLGMLSTDARLLRYERTAVPSLTNNLECWTKIGKKEMERLEKMQGRMLKRLLKVPESTSTWGVLKETGIWSL